MVFGLVPSQLFIMSSEIDLAIESILAKDSDCGSTLNGGCPDTGTTALSAAPAGRPGPNLYDNYASPLLFRRGDVQPPQSILDNPDDDFLLPASRNANFGHDLRANLVDFAQNSHSKDWPISNSANFTDKRRTSGYNAEDSAADVDRPPFCSQNDASFSSTPILDQFCTNEDKKIFSTQPSDERTFVRSDEGSSTMNSRKNCGKFGVSPDFTHHMRSPAPDAAGGYALSRPGSNGDAEGSTDPLDAFLLEFADFHFIEEAILDVVFDAHRSSKCGLMFLRTMAAQNGEKYRICGNQTGDKNRSSAQRPTADIFGQSLAGGPAVVSAPAANSGNKSSKSNQQIECVCPECNQTTAACRFAPHLEKCMGMGRNSSRVARRRLAAVSSSASLSSALCAKNASSSSNQRRPMLDLISDPPMARATRSSSNRGQQRSIEGLNYTIPGQRSTNATFAGQKMPSAKAWGRRLKVWIGDDDDDEVDDEDEEGAGPEGSERRIKGDEDYCNEGELEDGMDDEEAQSGASSGYSTNSMNNFVKSDDDWSTSRRVKTLGGVAKKRTASRSRGKKPKNDGLLARKRQHPSRLHDDDFTPTPSTVGALSPPPSDDAAPFSDLLFDASGVASTPPTFYSLGGLAGGVGAPDPFALSLPTTQADDEDESLKPGGCAGIAAKRSMTGRKAHFNKRTTLTDSIEDTPSPNF